MTRPIALVAWAAAAGIVALVASPTQTWVAAGLVTAGTWVTLVLVVTLPSRAERAGEELAARLAQFRHAVNGIGDAPTREQLEAALTLARALDLRDAEIEDDVRRLRASLDALTLQEQLRTGALPVLPPPPGLAPDDCCHFLAAARFGRRRSDQYGHLLLTSNWLKFHGNPTLSLAWSEIGHVQRAGADVIVSTPVNERTYRFGCQSVEEAARAGVLADHLRQARVTASTADVPRYASL